MVLSSPITELNEIGKDFAIFGGSSKNILILKDCLESVSSIVMGTEHVCGNRLE